MAQAARHNLRMQKELKLLLTDPPPGASFPSLSAAQSSSSSGPSLSSIDAHIQGPEGTVYANGIFKLKIQIPERYPFQPPIVTFATPIYHPNIDNGGRICLDILNLPPKGAWQPSLNISTVLTSIGLLLSEPNPDDGLMHEASQEYKYNRQAFDQKARSLTKKYASIGASEIATGGQGCQTLLKPSKELAEAKGSDTSMREVNDLVSQKRVCGISRKLSLESSELDKKSNDGKGEAEVPTKERQMELKGLKQESKASEHNQTHEALQCKRNKLSLEPSLSFLVRNDNDRIEPVSNQCSSTSKPQSLMDFSKCWHLVQQPGFNSQQKPNKDDGGKSKSNITLTKLEKVKLLEPLDSKQGIGDDGEKLLSGAQLSAIQFLSSGLHKNFPLPQTISHCGGEPHSEIVNGDVNGFTRIRHKKLGLAGRKFSGKLGSYQFEQKDNAENVAPNSNSPLAHSSKNSTSSSSLSVASLSSEADHCNERTSQNYTTFFGRNLSRTVQRQPLQHLGHLSNRYNANIQSEMQSLIPSEISDVQHDSCSNKKQQAKQDCKEKFAVGIKKQEDTSPSRDSDTSPSHDTDTVIVLDSEDSDEEQGRTASSRRLLERRRF